MIRRMCHVAAAAGMSTSPKVTFGGGWGNRGGDGGRYCGGCGGGNG